MARLIGEIERNRLVCGGGGDYNGWQAFITSDRKFASPTNSDKESIRNWLENYSEIENYEIGDFLDAWNEPKWNTQIVDSVKSSESTESALR